MISKNVRPGATAEGLTGETRQFTIKANGKAFRSMIDSLYTNKVLAVVRELCSNANDSHIRAGQTRPFKVTIPTSLNPIFSVRDFGTSMSHDDVMVMYTTIFESTNEDRNDTTGNWGLGSKSPFAYTDSFSAIAYSGTEKRVYLCFLGTDGIPSITHVATEPSDEPRGFEVSFAAKRESIRDFQKEMRFVSLGYDTPPEVEGMDLKLPEPRMKGTNWAIYSNDSFVDNGDYTRHYIRMGSALYPSNRNFPNVSGGYVTVTEIPIGAANVTSSRDALSYDSETHQIVADAMNAAYEELYAQMVADVAQAVTRRGVAAAWGKYRGLLNNIGGNSLVSLRNDDYDGSDDESDLDNDMAIDKQPGSVIQMAAHYGKAQNARRTSGRYASALEVELLDRVFLVVDDQFNKCVRRKARIKRFYEQNHLVYVFSAFNRKQLKEGVAWITKCFELKPEQITLVTDIPDVPPVRTPGVRGASSGPRRLAPGQYWMLRNNGIVNSELYGSSYRKGRFEWPNRLIEAMNTSGIRPTWDDIFWVTDTQYAAMSKRKGNLLPKARKLDVACAAMIERKAKKAPIAQAIEMTQIKDAVGRYNDQFALIVEQFFPHVKISVEAAYQTLGLAQAAKIDLQSREIRDRVNAKVKELAADYPLLFQRNDRKHYEQYIQAITAQKEAATQ